MNNQNNCEMNNQNNCEMNNQITEMNNQNNHAKWLYKERQMLKWVCNIMIRLRVEEEYQNRAVNKNGCKTFKANIERRV